MAKESFIGKMEDLITNKARFDVLQPIQEFDPCEKCRIQHLDIEVQALEIARDIQKAERSVWLHYLSFDRILGEEVTVSQENIHGHYGDP